MRMLLCFLLLTASASEPSAKTGMGALALTRFGYGPRGADRQALEQAGWNDTIAKQLAYERIDDSKSDAAVAALGPLPTDAAELLARYPKPNVVAKSMERMGLASEARPETDRPGELIQLLQARRLVRAVTTERQLYESMVELWLDHFNVFARKKGVAYAIPAYEEAIRAHALGSFADLLRAVAESAAMMSYLDNDENVRPGAPRPLQALPSGVDVTRCRYLEPQRAERLMKKRERNAPPAADTGPGERGINENYARELMELHTLGVDGGYTQHDVTEVARVFTGWTVFDPQGALSCPASGHAFFIPELHENGDKTVLGTRVASAGRDEGLKVLDLLAHHPATARFIATKLARRFVSDTPPSALVDRVAAVFTRTGGNLREVVRALATDPLTIAGAMEHAKVKRPFDLVVSSLRALDAETDGGRVVRRYLGSLNHLPYAWQTPNGYPETAERWTNVGALTQRLRFGIDLASNTIPGTHVELEKVVGADVASGATPGVAELLVDRIADRLLGQGISKSTRGVVIEALGEQTPPASRVVGLLLGSPEFQHR